MTLDLTLFIIVGLQAIMFASTQEPYVKFLLHTALRLILQSN